MHRVRVNEREKIVFSRGETRIILQPRRADSRVVIRNKGCTPLLCPCQRPCRRRMPRGASALRENDLIRDQEGLKNSTSGIPPSEKRIKRATPCVRGADIGKNFRVTWTSTKLQLCHDRERGIARKRQDDTDNE